MSIADHSHQKISVVVGPAPTIPSLVNGDRLTRVEFERRYEAMPHIKKAELIEGTVYTPSPVRLSQHSQPHSFLIGWLTRKDVFAAKCSRGFGWTLRRSSGATFRP